MWSSVSKSWTNHPRKAIAVGRRLPKFGVARIGPASEQQQAGNGKQELEISKKKKKEQGFEQAVFKTQLQQVVIMAAAAKIAKRVPLIKFPNRKAGETQGAVNRASGGGGGGQSQPMPSLPSGTATSQPPRTVLTEAEIDAILLGGAAP